MKKINSDSIKIYPMFDRGTNTNVCWSKLYTEHNISTISNRIVPIDNNSFIITSSLPSKVNNVWQSSDIFEFIIKGYYVSVQLKAIEEAINEEDVEYDYMEDFVWFTTEEKNGKNIIYANIKQNEYDGKDVFYNCIDGEDTADKTLSEDWTATFSFPILNYVISTDNAYLIASIYEDSCLNLVELGNVVINNKGEDLTITDNEFMTSQETDDNETKGNINIEDDLSITQTLQLSKNLVVNNQLKLKDNMISCGSDTNFIYMQDGTMVVTDEVVGSVSIPIYLNNGEINSSNKICTNLTENSVALGLINIDDSNINMGNLVSINKNDVSIGNSFYAKKDTSIGGETNSIETKESGVINLGEDIEINTNGQITFVNSYTAGDKNTPIYLNNGEFKSVTIPLVTMSSSGYLSSDDYKNLNALYNWYVSTSNLSLESISWKIISDITKTGCANCFWAVGDTKSITIEGMIGTLSIDTTLYCYILGFNHNSSIEGNNTIHFGTFNNGDSITDTSSICLVNNYESYGTDGTLYFNMNHWGPYNYGGWAACDLRYDILGSTDKKPSNYGSAKSSGVTDGGTPSSDCANKPVEDTLMDCLPPDLRAVMKGVTKWSNNTGGGQNSPSYVTDTIDYLPLLAEYEVFGARTYANSEEQNHQQQYDYYVNGENSKIKYQHSVPTTAARWLLRSASSSANGSFCCVAASGSANNGGVGDSWGISPVFVV